jgi:hypothetical protein
LVRLHSRCRPPPGRIVGYAGGVIPAPQILPQAGGVLDQSAWLMQVFDILDSLRLRQMFDADD